MKGSTGIPALQLVTMNKVISQLDKNPSNYFGSQFASVNYPSDTIEWELEYASGGMTPFVAPGSVAPTIGTDGVSKASAKAAFWKEKMYFDEEFLNNMRKVGTMEYETAERKLAKGLRKLRYRCERRREWMVSQMILTGAISYATPGGVKVSVSYGVPTTHFVTLAADRKWKAGANRNPVEDLFDAKKVLADDSGIKATRVMCNSELVKVLILDSKIQALLSKSAFGNGDLFANPEKVLATLLGIGELVVYDEMYEVGADILVTPSSAVISIDDATDFEVGGTLRFVNMTKFNVWEDKTITAVDPIAGTVTVNAQPTGTFVGGRDRVLMRKKFIQDNQLVMYADTVDGEKIAEFMQAPYGTDRRWGFYADSKDEWDPEGLWLRVQDKGLPVMYRPDATFVLTVF